MRILYVVNASWYFSLHWTARALASKHLFDEVFLASDFSDPEDEVRIKALGITPVHWDVSRRSLNPIRELASVYQLYKLVKLLRVDMVHSITVKPNLYSGFVCRALAKPQVVSVTGLGLVFSSGLLKYKLLRQLILLLYRCICRNEKSIVIFENGSDRKVFYDSNISSEDRLVLIRGAGVDMQKYHSPDKEVAQEVVILFAARMLWDKGLVDLISAVSRLRQSGLRVRLKVAGIIDEGSHNSIPRGIIEQWHTEGKIEWLGHEENMVKAITDADIVALPTKYGEGVPRVLIEAASCGRALVTTKVSGCDDIVLDGVNGFTIDPGDVDELEASLKKLVVDRDLRIKFGQAGRKIVKERYDETIVIRKTIGTYEKVLSA